MVPCFRYAVHTQDFSRCGRFCILQLPAVFIGHGADTAPAFACQDAVAYMKGAVLYQHAHHRAAALIQLGFYNYAVGFAVRVGFQFLHFSHQEDVFQKVIQADFLLGRNRGHNDIAAPVFSQQAFLGQFFLDTVRVGTGLIDLVNCYHNGHACILGVVDSFNGLRHNAVICCYDKHCNIRNLGTSGAHGRESFMTRGIQECNLVSLVANLVSTDTLGNAAGFVHGHIGLAQSIQQGGLAVVYVAHNGNHCRSGLQETGIIRSRGVFGGICCRFCFLQSYAEFFCQNFDSIPVQILVDGRHDTVHHQMFNDFADFAAKELCQFLHCHAGRQFHFCRIGSRFLFSHMLFLSGLVQGTGHQRTAFLFSAASFPILLGFLLSRFFSSLYSSRCFFHRSRAAVSFSRLPVLAGAVIPVPSVISVLASFPVSGRSSVFAAVSAVPSAMVVSVISALAVVSAVSLTVLAVISRAVFPLFRLRRLFGFFPSRRFDFFIFCFGSSLYGSFRLRSRSRFRFFRHFKGRIGFPSCFLFLPVRRTALVVKADSAHRRPFSRSLLCSKSLFQNGASIVIYAAQSAGHIHIVTFQYIQHLFICFAILSG